MAPARSATKVDDRSENVASRAAAWKLSRTELNFVVDTVLLVIFVLLMGVSAVVQFVFPASTEAAGWSLWGTTLDDWLRWQFALVAAMTLTVVLHVMLHWSWVCGVIASRVARWRGKTRRVDDGIQTLYGVALLVVVFNLLGALVAAAALMIRSPG